MDKTRLKTLEAARKVLAKQKAKEKENRDVRFTTRFTRAEANLIFKYAELHDHSSVVSYIRQCIADNIRLTKNATTY